MEEEKGGKRKEKKGTGRRKGKKRCQRPYAKEHHTMGVEPTYSGKEVAPLSEEKDWWKDFLAGDLLEYPCVWLSPLYQSGKLCWSIHLTGVAEGGVSFLLQLSFPWSRSPVHPNKANRGAQCRTAGPGPADLVTELSRSHKESLRN